MPSFDPDPEPGPVDEALERLLVQSLTDLLQVAGFAGGVLLSVTPGGTLCIISTFEPEVRITPAQLLRIALESLEAGEAGGGVPMNG